MECVELKYNGIIDYLKFDNIEIINQTGNFKFKLSLINFQENPGKTNIIDNLKKEYEYLLFKRDQLSQYDYVDSLTKQLDEIKKEISMKEYGIKYLKVNNLMNEKRIFQIKTNTPNITDYSKQLIDYKTKNDYYQKLIDKNSIIIDSNYKVIEIKQKKNVL